MAQQGSDGGVVAPFYAGRGVLVTGASGLLGKVLVEKLLYAVRDVGDVYMLMRPKRGKTAAERLRAIQDLPVSLSCTSEKSRVLNRFVFSNFETFPACWRLPGIRACEA